MQKSSTRSTERVALSLRNGGAREPSQGAVSVWQSTLKASVEFSGIGLHTGVPCRVVLRPAAEYAGITFHRYEAEAILQGTAPQGTAHIISASPDNVVRTWNGTTLENTAGESVATVEHLLAALAICGLDNVLIEVYGPEVPILDGSSALFVSKINEVGLATQAAPRAEISIDEPITVTDGERFIRIEPSEKFCLEISIEFEDCMIGHQSMTVSFDDPSVLARMAEARTFCRLNEVEALRSMDLIRGGSLENSIVIDGHKVLNGGELRDPYEFVLHKALDLIGDLYLLGAPIRGLITAHKPGHDLNTRAASAVQKVQFAQNSASSSLAASA